MTLILIALIELLVIIILSMCIKGLYAERVKVHANMKRLREQTTQRISGYNDAILKIAENTRLFLSQYMYSNKMKKNFIAREALNRFYSELERKVKQL